MSSILDVDAVVEWDQLDKKRFLMWGALFTCTLDSTLHPFEVVKTRLQVQGQPHVLSSYPQYSSFRDAVRQIARLEGTRGFFKGLAPAVSVSIPVQIVYYGSYEYSRYLLARQWWGAAKGSTDNDFAEFCIDATAGAIGEIMSGALWVPADLVSQRLMLQGPDRSKHLYTGMTDAVRKIWRAEGARGFYVGFGASLLTHIPNSATCWAVYEYTKKQLYRHWWWPRQGIQPGQTGSERTDGSHFVNMISAVTAGVVASAVSTPFDVIRVRKQAEGLSAALYSTPAAGAAPTSAAPNQSQQTFHDARLYRGSTLSSMRTLVAEVGWTGLFRGLVPRCLAAAPQAALLLVAYDLVKNLAKIDPPNRSNVN